MSDPEPAEWTPIAIEAFGRWQAKAIQNVEEWGLQEEETLLLAMTEEMGELTQAHLEAEHEGGDPERIVEEIDDLAALLLQMKMRIQHSDRGDDSD